MSRLPKGRKSDAPTVATATVLLASVTNSRSQAAPSLWICTTVPTSPASSLSSGRFFVSTTQSCSLILIQPPKDRRLSAGAQRRLHPSARPCARADADHWDNPTGPPPRSAGQNPSLAFSSRHKSVRACATPAPVGPTPPDENRSA